MKQAIRAISCALLIVLSIQAQGGETPQARGGSGSEVGNGGGDPWSMEFVAIGRRVVRELELLPEEKRYGADPALIASAIDRAKVESTADRLYLQGVEKTAINNPMEGRILINRQSWDSVKNVLLKRGLVLHEYLGILRIDDSSYQISARIFPEGTYLGNPCEKDEPELHKRVAAYFQSRGLKITRDNITTGNGYQTLTGSYAVILRGYEIGAKGQVSALMSMAECDPLTGKFIVLGNSSSGAGLIAQCPGSSTSYCPKDGSRTP